MNLLLIQDPRLLSDAYLSGGQYVGTRMGNNGVESPTYIQLENAAVSKPPPHNPGIYSPPNSYKQEFNEQQQQQQHHNHIYSVKNGSKMG